METEGLSSVGDLESRSTDISSPVFVLVGIELDPWN